MSDNQNDNRSSQGSAYEERIERLEAQNKRLTNQIQELSKKIGQGDETEGPRVSRRRALGGIISSGVLFGTIGTVSAETGRDDEDPFADEGHDHADDYLGESAPVNRIDVNGAQVGEVTNKQGTNASIQSAWDGLVVPVAPGLGASDAIDPSNTDTPVQDAIDAVANAGSGQADQGGQVIIPPEPVEEATTIHLRNGIHLLGQGIGYYNRNPPFDERDEAGRTPERVSKIRVNETGVDLIRADADQALHNNRLDGFIVEGPRSGDDYRDAATETGKGLHITPGTRLTRCTIGAIQFMNLSDSAVYAETDLVECNFGRIVATGVDAANHDNAVFEFQNTGYSNHIDLLATYPKKRSSGKDSDALRVIGQGDLSINVLNFGGTLARGVVVGGNSDGWLTIGGLNYEPGPQNRSYVVVEKTGGRGFEMGPTIIRGTETPNSQTLKQYCLLRNSSNSYIGPYGFNEGGALLNDRGIAIEEGTGGTNVVYAPSTDVENLSDDELSTPVACLGNLSLYTG